MSYFVINSSRTILRPLRNIRQPVVWFCDKKDSNDGAKEPKSAPAKKEASEKKPGARLNALLSSMTTDENITLIKKVAVPQAGGRKEKQKFRKEENAKKEAASEKKPETLLEAAEKVSKVVKNQDAKKIESELLSKLLSIEKASDDRSLNDLIVGMKIDRSKKDEQGSGSQSRSQFVRKVVAGQSDRPFRQDRNERPRERQPFRQQTPRVSTGSVNLFGEKPMNIFTDPKSLSDNPNLTQTWNKLQEKELKLAIAHPPTNYFQQMAVWTDEGKLWKFPIDNEQGFPEEHSVYFADHIFMEQHLEGWCPAKGPVRHFMDLVCVGLSKNSYLTVKEKRDHIMWFKDYFEEKKDILSSTIIDAEVASPKQISK